MKNSFPMSPLASSKKRPGDALTSPTQPPVAKKQKTDPQPPDGKDDIRQHEAKPDHPPSLTPRRPLPPPVVVYTKGPVTVRRVYYYPKEDAVPQSTKGQALPATAPRTQGQKPPAPSTSAPPKAPRTRPTASASQAGHYSTRTADGQKRYAFSNSDRPNKAKKSARPRARETIPAKCETLPARSKVPARSQVHAPSKVASASEKATQPPVTVPKRVEKKLTPEELDEQGKQVQAMMADIGLPSYKMPLRRDQLPSFRKKNKST